jgi:hypothetical protein
MQQSHLWSALKKQKRYYSGKKTQHTIKSQVVVNKAVGQIICMSFANGRRHDFRLFKESKLRIDSKIKAVVDTGYVGIQKFHVNLVIPIKRSKKRPLTKVDKAFNHVVSSERVLNEHVIGLIKRFKIVSDKYRNRRKRFGLRFNLIADICNYKQETSYARSLF